MKEISKQSSLLYIYTNHCVRGTTATTMKKSGRNLPEIAHVTKHKMLESLKYYLEMPTLKVKLDYSKDLFKYTEKSKENGNILSDSDDSDFEIPNPPKWKYKTPANSNKTKNQALVKHTPNSQNEESTKTDMVPSTQSNVMQMYQTEPNWDVHRCHLNKLHHKYKHA